MAVSLSRIRLLLGLSSPSGIWRLLAIIFALLNLKNIPLAWHFRFANGFFRHAILSPRRPQPSSIQSKSTPLLFQYLATTSLRSPFLECDYNLHKSNSTYFADLDIARTHLVTRLCARGMKRLQDQNGKLVGIALGGVHCSFKKQIRPYERYEIWSRVLCWDRKWLYLVSHFVSPRRGSQRNAAGHLPAPTILASAISKYVFKNGRLTIPPEDLLRNSSLLPAHPDNQAPPSTEFVLAPESLSASEETSKQEEASSTTAIATAETLVTDTAENLDLASKEVSNVPKQEQQSDCIWTWHQIEDERTRGMKIAEHFAALDALHEDFSSSKAAKNEETMGRFRDFLL